MMMRLVRNVAATIMFCVAATVANAQFAVDTTVDENGNGLITNTAGFRRALPATMAPDPGPGGQPLALTYDLLNPPGLATGDLIMFEPGGGISDIIRWNPNGTLVFYSDNIEGDFDLADTGFPAALYANQFIIDEVGPEDSNGVDYTPTIGQPGFVAGAAGPVRYHIISDTQTPEPGSLALLVGLGVSGGVFSVARRRRK
jgi:hypothetical protein